MDPKSRTDIELVEILMNKEDYRSDVVESVRKEAAERGIDLADLQKTHHNLMVRDRPLELDAGKPIVVQSLTIDDDSIMLNGQHLPLSSLVELQLNIHESTQMFLSKTKSILGATIETVEPRHTWSFVRAPKILLRTHLYELVQFFDKHSKPRTALGNEELVELLKAYEPGCLAGLGILVLCLVLAVLPVGLVFDVSGGVLQQPLPYIVALLLGTLAHKVVMKVIRNAWENSKSQVHAAIHSEIAKDVDGLQRAARDSKKLLEWSDGLRMKMEDIDVAITRYLSKREGG